MADGEMTLADIRNSVDSYNGHMMRGNSYKVRERTNQYFKSMFGFYPNKKGWERNVSNVQRRSCTGNSYEPCLGQKQDNGSYGLCSEQEAQGVVIEGTVYHVEGRDELDGTESILVTEISEIAYQKEQEAIIQRKAEQEEVDAIAAAIERGLAL